MHRSFRRVRADFLVVAVVVGLLLTTAASAVAGSPATVNVRIVGLNGATLLPPTQVTTTTGPINADGHGDTCSGTSAFGALFDATHGNWVVKYDGGSLGYEIDGLEGLNFPAFGSSGVDGYWSFWMNDAPEQVGACGQELTGGERIVFFAQCFQTGARCTSATAPDHYLTSTGPAATVVGAGGTTTLRVGSLKTSDGSGEASPPSGVQVTGGGQPATPDPSGQATLTFPTAGVYTVQATAPDSVPSQPSLVCVHAGNDGTCGTVAPNGTSTPAPGQPVASVTPASAAGRRRPLRSPAAGRTSIRPGARFSAGRAPRLLSGTVAVDGGNLRTVELRLQRRQGGRCQFFSVTLGRLRRATCGRGWLFRVGSRPQWSYLLPDSLPVGSYELDVVPYDASGARGASQTLTFRVAAPGKLSAGRRRP